MLLGTILDKGPLGTESERTGQERLTLQRSAAERAASKERGSPAPAMSMYG